MNTDAKKIKLNPTNLEVMPNGQHVCYKCIMKKRATNQILTNDFMRFLKDNLLQPNIANQYLGFIQSFVGFVEMPEPLKKKKEQRKKSSDDLDKRKRSHSTRKGRAQGEDQLDE